jgi:hypothetical protein
VDFGLKYFLPPPTSRMIVQEYARAEIDADNSWYVLFSAGVALKSALVVRRVAALGFKQTAEVSDDALSDLKISLLVHEGEPTLSAKQKLLSTAFRESARLVWPVPVTRNDNYLKGEPDYHPYQGPLVIGGDDNRYVLVALWSGSHSGVIGRAGANVDAWYISDEENLWKGNLQ